MAGLTFDVGMNIAGVRQGAEQIKGIFNELAQYPSVVSPSNMPTMAGQVGSSTIVPSTNNSLTLTGKEQHKELVLSINNLIQTLKEQNTASSQKKVGNGQTKDLSDTRELLKSVSQFANVALGVYQGITQYQTSQTRRRMREMAADPYGAKIEELQGAAGMTTTMANTLGTGLGIALSFSPLGPLGGMMIGQLVNQISSGVINATTQREISAIQERQMKVDKYRERIDIMDESYRRFGGSSMWETQGALLSASRGTGMDLDEFMRLSNRLSSYGVSTVGRAGHLANAAVLANRYTGADTNSLLGYLGIQERYRQGDAIGNMNYAYSAAISSGLQRNQFGEFLDGLQGVIETGISKGYVKSTKEVSDTMVMFNKLSGGSQFWQGEQGFQRLNQINNGLANATSLGSATQLAVYQAMSGLSGGDMLDTFAMMEKGLNVQSFNAIANRFKNIYGGDKYSEVMAWKELTGLNYTGAMQLQKMASSGRTVTDADIKQLQANYSTNSDQTRMKDELNTITTQVTKWGSDYFPEYLSMLKKISGVETPTEAKVQPSSFIKNIGDVSFVRSPDVDDYLASYLKTNVSEDKLRYLYSLEDFNNKYGTLLADSRNFVSNRAYDRYQNAGNISDEERAKLRMAAMKESEYNQAVLVMLVEQLKLLVETQGKSQVVYNMPRR